MTGLAGTIDEVVALSACSAARRVAVDALRSIGALLAGSVHEHVVSLNTSCADIVDASGAASSA